MYVEYIDGMLHSDYNILEAKINGKVIYKQNERYVEYTVSGADEWIYEYENWIFPKITNYSLHYYAELYTSHGVYYYNPYITPESDAPRLLANELEKVRIYYPDGISRISFQDTKWVDKITYIYTDDTITANIPYWLPVDNN